jgi:hypothetical protein
MQGWPDEPDAVALRTSEGDVFSVVLTGEGEDVESVGAKGFVWTKDESVVVIEGLVWLHWIDPVRMPWRPRHVCVCY